MGGGKKVNSQLSVEVQRKRTPPTITAITLVLTKRSLHTLHLRVPHRLLQHKHIEESYRKTENGPSSQIQATQLGALCCLRQRPHAALKRPFYLTTDARDRTWDFLHASHLLCQRTVRALLLSKFSMHYLWGKDMSS